MNYSRLGSMGRCMFTCAWYMLSSDAIAFIALVLSRNPCDMARAASRSSGQDNNNRGTVHLLIDRELFSDLRSGLACKYVLELNISACSARDVR